MSEDRRRTVARADWYWSGDLREAFREAVTRIPDPRAVAVAQAPVVARPAPQDDTGPDHRA